MKQRTLQIVRNEGEGSKTMNALDFHRQSNQIPTTEPTGATCASVVSIKSHPQFIPQNQAIQNRISRRYPRQFSFRFPKTPKFNSSSPNIPTTNIGLFCIQKVHNYLSLIKIVDSSCADLVSFIYNGLLLLQQILF